MRHPATHPGRCALTGVPFSEQMSKGLTEDTYTGARSHGTWAKGGHGPWVLWRGSVQPRGQGFGAGMFPGSLRLAPNTGVSPAAGKGKNP